MLGTPAWVWRWADLVWGSGLHLPGWGGALCGGLEDSWPGPVLEAGDVVEHGMVVMRLSAAWLRAHLPVYLTGN